MTDLRPLNEWNDARPGEPLAVVGNYEQFLQVLRARKETVGFSFAELDQRTGLPENYSSKVFGPSRCRNLGPLSFGVYLAALGLKLVVVADEAPGPASPKKHHQDRHPWQPDSALLAAATPDLIEEKRL